MGQLHRLVLGVGLVLNIASIDHVHARVVTRDSTLNQTGKALLTDEFSKFVKDNMDFWKIPGMTIAVVDGHDVFSEGYGFSALPETKVTPDTLFYAGSTTKAQTAACLSVLIQNGSYEALAKDWSAPLSSIITDDFVLQDEWATNHMTLDDIVSHRTGLPRHDRSLVRDKNGEPLSLRDHVRNMRNLPFPNEPRVKVIYGNYNYLTLSHVIETVTKKPLKQVMRELIWNPLSMKSTYFGLEEAKKAPEQLAKGYLWSNKTGKHIQTEYMPLTDMSGAGAVISNVRDYAKWIQGLLNETQLFSDDVHRDIRTPRMVQYAQPSNNLDVYLYGLGWYRSTFRGKVVYRHDGSMIGFKSQVYWFPDDKFGFVIFANGDEASTGISDISWKLVADKFQIPENELVNVTESRRAGLSPEANRDRAIDYFYPDRPKNASDPSFSMSDMAGAYLDAGYGKMTLRIVEDKQGQKVLVADRPDMTWHYGLAFQHVFGDNWIASEAWLEDMQNPGQFHPVQFVKGDDGKPSALKVTWMDGSRFEGNVTFAKVQE